MDPLDLTKAPPRGPRERALDLLFLPRTIDKFRAELPSGNLGAYITDAPSGASYQILAALGIAIDEFRRVIAESPTEEAVLEWLRDRLNPVIVAAINNRLDTLSVHDMPREQREYVFRTAPVSKERPDLTNFLDILAADDERSFGNRMASSARHADEFRPVRESNEHEG